MMVPGQCKGVLGEQQHAYVLIIPKHYIMYIVQLIALTFA